MGILESIGSNAAPPWCVSVEETRVGPNAFGRCGNKRSAWFWAYLPAHEARHGLNLRQAGKEKPTPRVREAPDTD